MILKNGIIKRINYTGFFGSTGKSTISQLAATSGDSMYDTFRRKLALQQSEESGSQKMAPTMEWG